MKRSKNITKNDHQGIELMVIEEALSYDPQTEYVAKSLVDLLKGRLSNGLLEILNGMLLGFNSEMQLEIADHLLDFTSRHVIRKTGCDSADAVLKSGYQWIAAEKGFELRF